MRSSPRFRSALLLLGWLATPALAQEVLSLDHAVALGLEQNQTLAAAGHDLDAARWGKLNAVTSFLPRVTVNAGVTRIDPESVLRANAAIDFIKAAASTLGIPPSYLSELRPFAYRDTYLTNLTVIQPIYNGGAEVVSLHAADATQDKSEYSYQEAEQNVIARVRISYYTVLKAQEMVALARESSERTSRYLEMTRRRAAVGTRTQTDVLRWEVQLAAGQGSEINAENYLAMARIQLNEAMGVDLNRTFTLETPPAPDSIALVASLAPVTMPALAPEMQPGLAPSGQDPNRGPAPSNPLQDRGLDDGFLLHHPSMQAMEANLRLADVGIEKSWINFKPRVNIAFQYGWEQNNTLALDGIRPWGLSLSVSLPIFSGFGDFTSLEKARYEYKRTEAQVQSFRRGLLMQAANARLSVRAARQRMETARKAQDQALDVLNSVSRRYETGGASNVDLIDVQTAYTSAKTDYITAVYDYLIAGVQLASATGTIAR